MARSHGRRQSAAETRAPPLTARSSRTAVAVIGSVIHRHGHYPVIWVQAVTHFWNGTQSFWPLPHCASGVFQNLMVWK